MKPSDSIKPLSYLKAHASEIVRDVTENQKTLIITQHGEAKLVVQDVASYEQTRESLALLKILALSANSVKNGRVKPVEKAFRDISEKIRQQP